MRKSELSHLVDDRFKQAEYFDNLADAFSTVVNLEAKALNEYVHEKRFLSGTNYYEVSDQRITELLFMEADEYLAKALCNICAACISLRQGYLSWGEVTTYYASFFAIHGLLRVQAKALGTDYVLFPKYIRAPASVVQHEYVVAQAVKNERIHEDVWRKFYDTYSQNTEIPQAEYGDVIFFSDVQNLVLEVERRNRFNYRMFDAYQEVFDLSELSRRSLFDLVHLTPTFFGSLSSYLGDYDRRYLAKAALRVRLLHDLLFTLSDTSASLRSHFLQRHTKRLDFMDAVLGPSDPVDRASIEESCLTLPTI